MALMEYKYDDMIHRCFRCGYCKFPTDWGDVTNCPAYARYRMESYSTGGRLCLSMLEDAAKVEGLEATLAVKDIAEIVHSAIF
jgi:hypothetical protein